MKPLFILHLIVFLTCSVAPAQEKINREFKVGSGKELALNLKEIGGSIQVEGWERDVVKIEGEVSGIGWDEDCELRFKESSSGIRVVPYCGYENDGIKVRFNIKVPKKFDLLISTATETRITGIEGYLDLKCGNANVEISDFKGKVDVSTANGRLDILNSKIEGSISNVNGNLTIENSNVEGKVTTTNSSMEINTANSGIKVKSVNGRISIDSAKDFVRANTVNGGIEIAELDGWIDAKTINGHVILNMVGNPEEGRRDIELNTMNGDVELFFPANFPMDVDIEIKNDYDGRNRNKYREKYKIVSDYDLEIEEKERRRGNYEIFGRGKVGSGKHRVRINAVNGDVYLKKAN